MACTTGGPRPSAGIESMPDELIIAILHLVPTVDIARTVQRLARRFYLLSNEPKLWLARCRTDFVYWTAEKRVRLDKAGRANTGSWKQMWLNRQRGDVKSARHFEKVLLSKKLRMAHLEAICRRGLDAKDFLLTQCSAPDGDDVLARRYFAQSALSSINRGLAVEEWCKVQVQIEGFGRLDRALGAFDMFVLHDGDEDMDGIERMLDGLADEFRAANPRLATMTTRQTALALLQWVRSKDLVGLAHSARCFRNVRNCLIGHALTEPGHPSLPIVSSVIYTSLATRLGLQAYCCAVPGHVYSTVLARRGSTVDGTPVAEAVLTSTSPGISPATATDSGPVLADNGERMFLDPYSHGQEVRLEALRSTIVQLVWGAVTESRDSFLLPAPTSAIVLRVALNLEASYAQAREVMPVLGHHDQEHVAAALQQQQQQQQQQQSRELLWLRRGDEEANLEALLYATTWVAVLMRPISSIGWRRHVDLLLARLARRYGEDAWIVERYLVPLFDRHQQYQRQLRQLYDYPRRGLWSDDEDEDRGQHNHRRSSPESTGDWTDPRVMVRLIRNLDQRLPEASRRYTQEICASVRYRVGQVFRHRRFGFVAIINGWTLNESGPTASRRPAAAAVAAVAAKTPPAHNRPKPAFYTCLRVGDDRYVVEQNNVDILTDASQIPHELFFLAGQHFKRFDVDTCTFVSNIREFFPDD
ncbi:f-box domain containing protein [Grosmannia clavigera kw1407]|uniref:F-box domain containing protein n=1 Tax=Grosmannia clavigera (strain kw1407 / UAMH 11150) TaxID=655863 RepID=F0XR81_GROCL|nr:f-box domain containing protein [Grosmannia clavigera kw1407]EFW99844.1 f-box domain containing protein [Grosmannia clavigera kw1407]